MSPDKQRIAIAEACGFVPNGFGCWTRNGTVYTLHGESEDLECCGGPGGGYTPALPNYPADLNAMHEAEVALEANMQVANTYWTTLAELCCADDEDLHTSTRYRYIGSATAAQRAEAFLRTIGKWEDEP